MAYPLESVWAIKFYGRAAQNSKSKVKFRPLNLLRDYFIDPVKKLLKIVISGVSLSPRHRKIDVFARVLQAKRQNRGDRKRRIAIARAVSDALMLRAVFVAHEAHRIHHLHELRTCD